MATFNYVRLGSRVGVIQNGRTNRRWFSPEDIKPIKDTERGVMILEALNNGSYSATINPATDTVVLDGTTIAAGGTLDALETALVGSSVFLKPSSGGGGGNVPSGNEKQVVGYDASGDPIAVSLGLKQLSDINGIPPFANGVVALTAINPTTGVAFKSVVEMALGTPKNGTIANYSDDGVMKVNNGVSADDAVNKGQLDVVSLLPLDSKAVFLGDSQIARWLSLVTAASYATQSYGYPTFAQLANNGGFYMPLGSNLGVAGNTSAQVLARLGQLDAFPDAKVVVLTIGTNDLAASATAISIDANVGLIINKILAKGAKVILTTVLPRFSPNALTAPQEAQRLALNTLYLARASSNVLVVDATTQLNNTSNFIDGLHVNSIGAQIWGFLVGTAMNSLMVSQEITNALTIDNSYTSNLVFAGTTTATNWNVTNNTGGATVTPTIVVENGENVQQIAITGSYTGNTRNITFHQNNYSTNLPSVGDVIEMLAKFKVSTNDANIVGVTIETNIWNASFASLATTKSYFLQDRLSNQLVQGSTYIIRSPSIVVTAGLPAFVRQTLTIELKDQASSTPINGVVKIYKVGVRKINYLEPNINFANSSINPTTTALTLANLNTAYGTVPAGFRVICKDITGAGLVYTKTIENGASDLWVSNAITTVV